MTKTSLWNSGERFGVVAQALHWGMFALIALQLVGGHVLEALPRKTPIRSFAFGAHETIGLIVVFLVFARLSWKVANVAPIGAGPRWQHVLARLAHLALYVLMLAVPAVGYAMVDAKGYDASFFAWKAPDFIATDKALGERLEDTHAVLAWALTATVAVHVAGAVWHHVVLRDGVLRRMLPAAARQPNTGSQSA